MKRIPITAARGIARATGARQVVIWACDKDGAQHVTTYGISVDDSRAAAEAGNHVKRAAGWPEELCQARSARARKRDAEREFAESDLAAFNGWAQVNAKLGPNGFDYESAAEEWRALNSAVRAVWRTEVETARRALRGGKGR